MEKLSEGYQILLQKNLEQGLNIIKAQFEEGTQRVGEDNQKVMENVGQMFIQIKHNFQVLNGRLETKMDSEEFQQKLQEMQNFQQNIGQAENSQSTVPEKFVEEMLTTTKAIEEALMELNQRQNVIQEEVIKMQGVIQQQQHLTNLRMKEEEARLNKSMEEKFNMIQRTCMNEFLAQKNFLQDRLSEQEKHMSDILM